MKKIILYAVCVAIIVSSVFCGAVVNTTAQSGKKVYYNDFNSGLLEGEANALPTGNGDNTSFAREVVGLTYSCEDGALNLKMTNGNNIRMANTMTGVEAYKYMVVRMKGTYDWEVLEGNTIGFLFGGGGRLWDGDNSDIFFVPNEKLTADYSDVVIEIPEGYFDAIADPAYWSDLFIVTMRGANFDITIDEIYFCNNYPVDGEPEEVFEKDIYSDFNEELILNNRVVSDGADGWVELYHAELCTPTFSDGAMKVTYDTPDSYVRFMNSLQLTDSTKKSLYKYMVLRMKGTASKDGAPYTSGTLLNIIIGNWGNQNNPIVMDASLLNADEYVDVVLELKDINFAGTAEGFESGLIIKTGGNLDIELDIDEIYFCDTLPPEDSEDNNASVYYNNFDSGLSDSEANPLPTGNGDNTSFVRAIEGGLTYTCEDGALNLKLTNGNYIRMANSMTGIENYRYMVVRMKGTNSWGEGLTGNSIGFLFGNAGRLENTDAIFFVPAEKLTEDYSDVIIEIPEGYFDGIADPAYYADLFITTRRGANFDIYIDEIYFSNSDEPSPPETPEEPEEPEESTDVIYSEFTEALVKGTAVSNGADGTITLFEIERGTQSVEDGMLNVSLTDDGYIRFTSSVVLTDDCKTSKYKYMVIKLKGSATAKDGSAVSGDLLKVVFASWGNEGNPVMIKGSQINADDFTTLVLELKDENFANTHQDYASGLILRNAGLYNTDLVIDTIYFTDEKPAEPEKPEDPEEPEDPKDPEETTDFIYSEFTDALIKGTAVPNGAGGTITLFEALNATQSVADGNLNVALTGIDGYIRFTSSLALTEDCKTTKYKYMVIKLKGSAAKEDGSAVTGNLINVIFGSWGNEGSPAVIAASQINADDFTTVVLELNDKNFASTHQDYASGLILKNAGNFNSNIVIDSIYFTDVKPATAPVTPSTPPTVVTKDKVYYSDFSTPLVEGAAVSNGDDGTVTLFNMIECTQSVSGGALNLKLSGEGAYARFSSSLVLTEDCKTSKYKYMVVKIKGSAKSPTGSAATGNVLKFIMGSWGNENYPLLINASNLTSDYNTIVFELKDNNFSATHADYVGGLIIQNAGNFKTDVTIDEIYFTDVKPAGVSTNTNNVGSDNPSNGSSSDDTNTEENPNDTAGNSGDKDDTSAKDDNSKDDDEKSDKADAEAEDNSAIGLVILVVFAAIIVAFCIVGTALLLRGKGSKAA